MVQTRIRARSLVDFGLSLLVLIGFLVPGATAEVRRILMDGFTGDWAGLAPIHSDPSGDGGASGIDITGIYAADDEEHLYLRFVVNTDLVLQGEDDELSLYLDTDNNSQTGFPQPPLGVELRWDFGGLGGFLFTSGGWTAVDWYDVGLISAPTHSGTEFELCFDRDAVPDGVHALFPGSTIRLLFHDWAGGGDWAPNYGGAVSYTFDQGSPPAPIDTVWIEKDAPGACRLMTQNVLQDNLFDPWKQIAFGRLYNAIEPDVICLQEIYDHSASQTEAVIETLLGGDWTAGKIGDQVLVTRGAIAGSWNISGGRGGAFRISPLGAFAHDLLVINCHLSCCAWNDPERQAQADAVMAFVRDARSAGGLIDLTEDSPIIITGDMNFVGSARQLETLLTGDIADNTTYGPDFAPDWDETDLADEVPRHPAQAMTYTWYKPISADCPGRLDYILYSDSNTETRKRIVLQTVVLPESYLDLYGLEATDSSVASDHLPTFADLHPRGSGAVAEAEPFGGLRLVLDGPQPIAAAGARVRLVGAGPAGVPSGGGASWDEAAHAAALLEIFDLAGRRLRTLSAEPGRTDGLVWTWDGRDGGGRHLASGSYWALWRGADLRGAAGASDVAGARARGASLRLLVVR